MTKNPGEKYDLAVAYRIYPKVAKTALGLPLTSNKAQLAEVCLQSFRRSLGGLRTKIWVLLDGCPPYYADIFRRYFAEDDLTLVPLPAIGNYGTFNRQIEILLGQNESEMVYFAEDDYFYLPDQFRFMMDFLQASQDVAFISPYDHRDSYTMPLHEVPVLVREYGGHRWKTAASTCLTFLTTRSTLKRTESVFRTYARRNYDCSMWLSLTKERVREPWAWPSLAARQPFSWKIISKAWLFGWHQILFGKRQRLWTPVPGIATHMDTNALSPGIDWVALMQKEAAALERNASGPK
ncbi:MAG TPA: glycosyltransferase family 2 protein [Candidatus Angelobacter sp.]|nr:glycosyltransferase family 2 protein [Candidatus Angelobacter sp.]